MSSAACAVRCARRELSLKTSSEVEKEKVLTYIMVRATLRDMLTMNLDDTREKMPRADNKTNIFRYIRIDTIDKIKYVAESI